MDLNTPRQNQARTSSCKKGPLQKEAGLKNCINHLSPSGVGGLRIYFSVFSVALNELAAWGNFITHQHTEGMVALGGVFNAYLL